MSNMSKAPGTICQAQGPLIRYETTGNVILKVCTSRGEQTVTLTNVILLRDGNFNLFSPRVAARSCGGSLRQDREGRDCIMVGKGPHCMQVARSTKRDNRLYLDQVPKAASGATQSSPRALRAVSKADELEVWRTWHCRLGHASLDRVRKTLQAAGVDIGSIPHHFSCDTCNATRFTRPSFGTGRNKTKAKLDIVISDVQGPMPAPSLGGARYALTVTDLHTRCTWFFPIATKDAALSVIGCWLEEVKQENGRYPTVFRSDGGGEYTLTAFRHMLRQRGVVQQTTAPYLPQQNSVSERLNLTLMNVVRPMLDAAGLPASFWAEATRHAVSGRAPDT